MTAPLSAVATSFGALAGALLFGSAAAVLGARFLLQLDVVLASTEQLIVATALGVVAIEAAISAAQWTGHVRLSLIVLCIGGAAYARAAAKPLFRVLASTCERIWRLPRRQFWGCAAVLVILLWEGVAATAPLTGSDALFYHFKAPADTLRFGFHPNFSIANSFFVGQGHELILLGLALRSEKLALAILWLGGALTTLSLAWFVSRWAPPNWAIGAALAFSLCPIVVWQMTSGGTPDLWTAFLTVAAALTLTTIESRAGIGDAIVLGVLAGGIAGAKYTNCAIAGTLLALFAVASRSLRLTAIFSVAGLVSGVAPYLRNFLWTGDPFFPLGLRWIAPEQVNWFALAAMRAGIGASAHSSASLLGFPFFFDIAQGNLGFWQFFGPLVLAFALPVPSLIKRERRLLPATLLWVGGAIGVGVVSSLLRYLLPLFPIALAVSLVAASRMKAAGWRTAHALSATAVGLFVLLGIGGMVVYTRPAVAASVGAVSRDEYLRQRSPNYEVSVFLNDALAGAHNGKRVLVFFRHLYYLRVPYCYGQPDESWSTDPNRLRTVEDWRRFFHEQNIGWVLRSPEYPKSIAESLQQLEGQGVLVPVTERQVDDFAGNRMLETRTAHVATLFSVKE